ncbi:MAG: TIGR02266 family protein [bacterium]
MSNDSNLLHQVRKQQRKLICIPVLLSIEGTNNFKIDYTTDMSMGGILIQTQTPLKKGTRLDIRFRLPGAIKLIEAKGEVVWSHEYKPGTPPTQENLPGMGIKFLELDEQSKRYLSSYIETEKGTSEEDIFFE